MKLERRGHAGDWVVAASRRYETDLTDQERERIREVVTQRSQVGWPRQVDLREVMNALL
jgi:hypothetical protein